VRIWRSVRDKKSHLLSSAAIGEVVLVQYGSVTVSILASMLFKSDDLAALAVKCPHVRASSRPTLALPTRDPHTLELNVERIAIDQNFLPALPGTRKILLS
jgi:hypothetical protein